MWKWQMYLGFEECLVVGQARLSGGNSLEDKHKTSQFL